MIIQPDPNVNTFKRGHCVYFIRCNDYVKIGTTADLSVRLDGIRCNNPFDLQVLLIVYTRKNGYLEGWFHRHFAAYRYRNEWFTLDNDAVHAIMLMDLPYIVY